MTSLVAVLDAGDQNATEASHKRLGVGKTGSNSDKKYPMSLRIKSIPNPGRLCRAACPADVEHK